MDASSRPLGAPDPNPIKVWQDAEHNAVAWMRYLGHPDARATGPGPDGGIDLVASGAIGQVKARIGKASRPEIQRLAGAAERRADVDLFFFSFGGYTPGALEWADRVGVAAFTFTLDGNVIAVTSTAEQLLREAVEGPQANAESPLRDGLTAGCLGIGMTLFGIFLAGFGLAARQARGEFTSAIRTVITLGVVILVLGVSSLVVAKERLRTHRGEVERERGASS